MQDLKNNDFDPIKYINEQINLENHEGHIEDRLSELITNIKISEKKNELQGEQSMNYVNDRLEQFWDLLESSKNNLLSLEE
jgi:hypothetical protein